MKRRKRRGRRRRKDELISNTITTEHITTRTFGTTMIAISTTLTILEGTTGKLIVVSVSCWTTGFVIGTEDLRLSALTIRSIGIPRTKTKTNVVLQLTRQLFLVALVIVRTTERTVRTTTDTFGVGTTRISKGLRGRVRTTRRFQRTTSDAIGTQLIVVSTRQCSHALRARRRRRRVEVFRASTTLITRISMGTTIQFVGTTVPVGIGTTTVRTIVQRTTGRLFGTKGFLVGTLNDGEIRRWNERGGEGKRRVVDDVQPLFHIRFGRLFDEPRNGHFTETLTMFNVTFSTLRTTMDRITATNSIAEWTTSIFSR